MTSTRLAVIDTGQVNERILNKDEYRADFRKVEGASLKRTTSCGSLRNRSKAKRMAVRLPMPGKVANWSTAWSSKEELSAMPQRCKGFNTVPLRTSAPGPRSPRILHDVRTTDVSLWTFWKAHSAVSSSGSEMRRTMRYSAPQICTFSPSCAICTCGGNSTSAWRPMKWLMCVR